MNGLDKARLYLALQLLKQTEGFGDITLRMIADAGRKNPPMPEHLQSALTQLNRELEVKGLTYDRHDIGGHYNTWYRKNITGQKKK